VPDGITMWRHFTPAFVQLAAKRFRSHGFTVTWASK